MSKWVYKCRAAQKWVARYLLGYLCNKKANDSREPDTRIRPERTEQEKTRLSRSCPLFFGSGGGGELYKKYGLHYKGGTQALHEGH